MAVLAVTNQKGGVGKSTLTLNLGCGLADIGDSVTIIDADPQGSLLRASLTTTSRMPSVLTDATGAGIRKAARSSDWVLVDTLPGFIDESIIDAADLVIVPVRPAGFDDWSTDTLVQVLREHDTPAVFVVSIARRNALTNDLPDVLESHGYPVLSSRLSCLTPYEYASMQGQSVLDYEPRGKAAGEVRALTDEILALLK